jgi:hypothetical protein
VTGTRLQAAKDELNLGEYAGITCPQCRPPRPHCRWPRRIERDVDAFGFE